MKLSDYVELNPRVVLTKGESVPFVSMDSVTPGHRWVRPREERPAKGSGSKFSPGDTLFARITPCLENGKIAQYAGERPGMGSTEFFVLRARSGRSDPAFVYYFSQNQELRSAAEKSMSGASGRQRADISTLSEYECEFPSFQVQRRTAGILSVYDELIENNRRRIWILEEMIRDLYREWFIEFRFPGYGSFQLAKSAKIAVQQGWKTTTLETVCAKSNGIQTGPFGSQLHESDYSEEGVPVVMPKNLIGFRIRTEDISRIPEHIADRLGRHRMTPGDIVYGRRGDIGRRAFLMANQKGWFCGTGCLRIRPDTGAVNGWFLFNYLGQDDVVSLIAGRAHGATMPNLNTTLLATVPITLPPRTLQDEFARLTFPMTEMCEILLCENEKLQRSRDLLLPRMLSGQVTLAGKS